VAVGQNPYGVLNLPHAKKVFVSDWGSAAVTVVNTESHRTEATIAVGVHPTAMVLSPDRRHLYVSDSNSDTISVIDTVRLQRVNTISVGLLAGHALGSAPEGLTIAPDGSRLYVATAGDNAVAVVALADHGVTGTIVGRIPSGEYPTSVTIDKKGRKLFIINGYGYGPRADFPGAGRDPIYYNYIAGTMSVVAVAGGTQLRTYTSHVGLNNHIAPRNDRSPFGATSPIKHP
jgi:YVTN family beta-propeller protein